MKFALLSDLDFQLVWGLAFLLDASLVGFACQSGSQEGRCNLYNAETTVSKEFIQLLLSFSWLAAFLYILHSRCLVGFTLVVVAYCEFVSF